jgi:hypothetical protein
LQRFCVTSNVDSYWFTLSQKSGDLHGFVYFLEGVSKRNSSAKFLVSIRDLETGKHGLKGNLDFCRAFGLNQEICKVGEQSKRTIKFAQSVEELGGAVSDDGIQIDVLDVQHVDVEPLLGLAVPCVATRDGTARCGSNLGICRRSVRWAGCDLVRSPR